MMVDGLKERVVSGDDYEIFYEQIYIYNDDHGGNLSRFFGETVNIDQIVTLCHRSFVFLSSA